MSGDGDALKGAEEQFESPRDWTEDASPHELSAGTTDDQLGPLHSTRRIAPRDALVDDDDPHTCYVCGHVGTWPELRRTVPKDAPTRIDFRCTDSVGCLRRRNR